MNRIDAFADWQHTHTAPYHFPMSEDLWDASMYDDVDSDGRVLFDEIHTKTTEHAMIQYGYTAFGFDDNGEISDQIHYAVIRDLYFDPACPSDGLRLLDEAMDFFGNQERIYAFFHYFGMSACAQHGKLHESQRHIHDLLLENGFQVEHENVYYAKVLNGSDAADERISLTWQGLNAGSCREFAVASNGQEFGWGQVHFLPQGHIAYLRWIYIDEKRQHQGLGTAAMNTLCAQLHGMGITRFDTDTALNNTAAQGYYEKTGFTNGGITRSYYKNKND